jgi:phosphohistidine phosphatase
MAEKRLFILRHALAEWPEGMEDRDRPLAQSGHRDAQALARKMKQKNYRPDLVLCSSARRTRETYAPIHDLWPDVKVDYLEQLYLASTGGLYEMLKGGDDAYDNVLLIGHNPGIHGLVQLLTGEGNQDLMVRVLTGYQAGCLSVLECDCVIWADLMPGACRLADLFVGKELP